MDYKIKNNLELLDKEFDISIWESYTYTWVKPNVEVSTNKRIVFPKHLLN